MYISKYFRYPNIWATNLYYIFMLFYFEIHCFTMVAL